MKGKKIWQDKNGKASSKRIPGLSFLFIAMLMGILGGFDFYNPEIELIITFCTTGTALVIPGTFEKKDPNTEFQE